MSEIVLRGVSCPSCAGSLEITQGTTLLDCQFCGAGLMVRGDAGLPRYYVPLSITKEQVLEKIQKWFGKIDKAPDLKKVAKITEMFPVFIPFWRINAKVIGWVLGEVKKRSKNQTTYEPVERHVHENYEYTCPACDIGEFGVKWVDLKGDEIRPFHLESVQSQGMTFGTMTTPADALRICDEKFMEWAEKSAGVDRVTLRRLHKIGDECSLVYYPLWITRYEYKNRIYQITADGESGELLYGRAPGNNLYRVGWLMTTISAGDFILTTGLRSGGDDNVVGLAVVSFVIMYAGFRKFRHGGEVKIEQKDKLKPGIGTQLFDQFKIALKHR